MNDYREVKFAIQPPSADASDLLADALCSVGFESFEPSEDGSSMTAYVPAKLFDIASVRSAIESVDIPCQITFEDKFIPGEDWNAEWEANYFKPIVIDSSVVIHSSFHHDVPPATYDILIDPKMAFGTGHHSTTSLMISQILKLDFKDSLVVDMGTGTGILAILAALRGAKKVTAIEIDEFAFTNTRENLSLNNVSSVVEPIHGDAASLAAIKDESINYFFANINRNIILADLASYSRTIKQNGILLLSGFYVEDIPSIEEAAGRYGLRIVDSSELEKWACLKLCKTN